LADRGRGSRPSKKRGGGKKGKKGGPFPGGIGRGEGPQFGSPHVGIGGLHRAGGRAQQLLGPHVWLGPGVGGEGGGGAGASARFYSGEKSTPGWGGAQQGPQGGCSGFRPWAKKTKPAGERQRGVSGPKGPKGGGGQGPPNPGPQKKFPRGAPPCVSGTRPPGTFGGLVRGAPAAKKKKGRSIWGGQFFWRYFLARGAPPGPPSRQWFSWCWGINGCRPGAKNSLGPLGPPRCSKKKNVGKAFRGAGERGGAGQPI